MLLDATRFYSLGLQALGIQVNGAAGQELVSTSSFLPESFRHHYYFLFRLSLEFTGFYF
ncbi:hypothetical protein Bca4012_041346 [Brassica carinata]|uniref:Uncharacterized protein n=3 Tax=Brassica TaxID=3705 RepID=A0A0D3E1T8_BRAOL|nr:unnamed protein product [Brassica napus]VDD28438.1 unnamed protein product [Brassica oleracea]